MPFAPYIHLPPYSSFIFDTFALSWSQGCVTGGKAMLRLGHMTLVFCTLSATYPAGWVITGWESRIVGLEPKLATSHGSTHPPTKTMQALLLQQAYLFLPTMPFAPYIHLPPYSSFIFDTFALSWSQECVTGGKAMLRLGHMTLVFCTLSATYPHLTN